MHWNFIAVYGCHSQELRKGFWSFITALKTNCGDFHSVLLTEDRVNGVPVSASEIADFTDCMSSHSLYQVKTVGAWCNNQKRGSILELIGALRTKIGWIHSLLFLLKALKKVFLSVLSFFILIATRKRSARLFNC